MTAAKRVNAREVRRLLVGFAVAVVLAIGQPSAASAQLCASNGDCNDRNVCTTDTCSSLLRICIHATNTNACDDGLYCNGADTCSGGTCSQHAGNPCFNLNSDADCTGLCNDTANDCSGAEPNGSACSDGLYCNGADTCFLGTCASHSGNPCPGADGDSNCSESCDERVNSCTANDPAGSTCSDGNACTQNDTCSSGTCQSGTALSCNDRNACTNDACNSLIGCTHVNNTNACDDGLYCNGADTCSGGTCSQHAGNPCFNLNSDADCTGLCNDTANDCSGAEPNGSACSDGLHCNGADTCRAGGCVLHAGDPCAAAHGDADCTGGCSETADSCSAAEPTGSPCSDGQYCNGADSCARGTCATHAGNPCPGADGDLDCSESCNELLDNCNQNDPNGSACNDADACTDGDSCSSGSCQPGTVLNCSDDNPCTDDACVSEGAIGCVNTNNTAPCDDDVYCNGTDICAGGSCGHSGDPCTAPDSDADCTGRCDETVDGCSGVEPDGSDCSDDAFCTGVDTCSGGNCDVHAGDPCDDGVACTADSCDDTADACTNIADDAECDDGEFCNGAETCGDSEGCLAGVPVACDDGVTCTDDECDEEADACVSAANEALCDDGAFCNGIESCDPVRDCIGGSMPCDDGVPCTGDECDEDGDACAGNVPSNAACADGVFCNGIEVCDGLLGCQPSTQQPCGDADSFCSVGACREETQDCEVTPQNEGEPCDDGNACSRDEVCTTGACVGTVPRCGQPVSSGGSPVASDALFALSAAIGVAECDNCTCDVNGDGGVSASDALTILGIATGQDIALLCNAKVVFVTSLETNADFAGATGADLVCATLASTVPALAEKTFKAWVADALEGGPVERFGLHPNTPYVRRDKVVVAHGWADLADSQLLAELSVDENGNVVEPTCVWTQTLPGGERHLSTHSCAGFTYDGADDTARTGWTTRSDKGWTDYDWIPCNEACRLYCIEE